MLQPVRTVPSRSVSHPTDRGGRHQKTQAEVLESQRALLPGSPRPNLLTGGLTWPEKNPLEPLLGPGAESWPAQLSGLWTSRELLPTALRAIWGALGKGRTSSTLSQVTKSTDHAFHFVCHVLKQSCPPQPAGPLRGALVLQMTGLPSLIPTRALCSETWFQ